MCKPDASRNSFFDGSSLRYIGKTLPMTVLMTEVVKNGVTSLISYINWLSRGILLEMVFSTLRLIFNDFLVGLCIFNGVHNKVDFC